MSDIALYYPYVNFHDEAWLKAAVLYWPKIGRVRPYSYYDVRDSDTVKQLNDELQCIVDVQPGVERGPDGGYRNVDDRVDKVFYAFLARHRDDLLPRYGVRAMGVDLPPRDFVTDRLLELDPRLEEVHPGKMSWRLANRLADDGLLVRLQYWWERPSDGKWLQVTKLAMHRKLAFVYLAVLAEAVARANQMATITDQPVVQAASSGWTVEALAAMLLDHEPVTGPADVDVAQAFAVAALRVAVPRDLGAVPVSRIIEARRRLQPELLAFRTYLDSLADVLVEVSEVPDPEIRSAKLQLAVERHVVGHLDRTERELRRLGLEPVRALLSIQTLAPPAVLAFLGRTLDAPSVVTGSGVVAGCIVGAMATAVGRREETRRAHPTGYLLGLRRELAPSDAVAEVRRAFRQAARSRRRRGRSG